MPRLTRTPTKRSRSAMKSSSSKTTTKSSPTSKMFNVKNYLSVSFVDNLIGRDDEYEKIYSTIKLSLEQKSSSIMYISGPAGTGKTLTTNTVLNDLKSNYKFKLISINCMTFFNAGDLYEKILSNFERKSKRSCVSSTNNQLQVFKELKDTISVSKHMILIMLDEIDQLQTKNDDVLNNLFKLATLFPDKIVLIGIANTLNFTARLPWLKDFGDKIFHEFRFLPYSKEQIFQILETRLKMDTNNENLLIDRNAIEFCARKIASSSGDIRKALDVCRRAIELIDNLSNNNQDNSKMKINPSPLKSRENIKSNNQEIVIKKQVDILLMMEVLNKVYGNAIDKLTAATPVKNSKTKTFLPSDQQVILCVFLIFLKTKSLREIKLQEFRELLLKICKRNGITLEGKTESDIMTMCQYLADYGYVMVLKKDGASQLSSIKMTSGSPFKRTGKKISTITLQLLIDPNEAEQLLTTFHRSIISEASSYFF